ncbi:MAG: hypothetical protein KAT66_00545 [Candidatus Lokiarchaeota archaeon]|nr:hypothetical protein [Candidatus Lokiarchaeota archaeon]
MLKGYDIDGVITEGIVPESDAVIITGRSREEAPETYTMLYKRGIFNAVYFNAVSFEDKTRESSGFWKSLVINLLGVEEFYEDEKLQADIIRRNCKRCNLILVK